MDARFEQLCRWIVETLPEATVKGMYDTAMMDIETVTQLFDRGIISEQEWNEHYHPLVDAILDFYQMVDKVLSETKGRPK